MAGWENCKGAGLLACANSIQPPKKLNTEAMVIHSRIPRLMIFIFAAFRCFYGVLVTKSTLKE